MEPTSVNLAVDWITFGTGLGTDTKTLIINIFIPLLCLFFVCVVGVKTRSPGPTLVAVIFSGIVWGLAADMSAIKESTSDTVEQYDGGATVIQGDQ
ncbi:hypothetical protein ACWD4T_00560 [Streptomyces umbrinus]